MKYTARSDNDVIVYQDHYTKSAKIGKLKRERTATGEETWRDDDTNDLWLRVETVNEKPMRGWLPIILFGRDVCQLEANEVHEPEPPAPPSPLPPGKHVIRIDIVYEDNTTESLFPSL